MNSSFKEFLTPIPIFLKNISIQTWDKMRRPKYIIIGLLGASCILIYQEKKEISQINRIHNFQKDFAENKKPAKEIYVEGLRMIGNAPNAKECFVITEALWMLAEQDKSKKYSTLEMVEASNDKIWRNCL